jgi:hypothetical protein
MFRNNPSVKLIFSLLTIITCLSPILVSISTAMLIHFRKPFLDNYEPLHFAQDVLSPSNIIFTAGLIFTLGLVHVSPNFTFWNKTPRLLRLVVIAFLSFIALRLVWVAPKASFLSFALSYYARARVYPYMVAPKGLSLISVGCSIIVLSNALRAIREIWPVNKWSRGNPLLKKKNF